MYPPHFRKVYACKTHMKLNQSQGRVCGAGFLSIQDAKMRFCAFL